MGCMRGKGSKMPYKSGGMKKPRRQRRKSKR